MPPDQDIEALLPPDIRVLLPPIFGSGDSDATAFVKLLLPGTGWAFYLAEFDGRDGWYGLWCDREVEQGIFFLSDVMALRSPDHGLPVERDPFFTPTKLSELRRLHLAPGQPVFSDQTLLPPELRIKFTAVEQKPTDPDPMAWVRFVLPNYSLTWYICTFNGDDTCFGLEAGDELKIGEFSLSEIQALCNPYTGEPIERDDRFSPTRISELRRRHMPRLGGASREPNT